MIKAVIDNNVWVNLLLTQDPSLEHIFKSTISKKLEVYLSDKLSEDLKQKLKRLVTLGHIDIKVAVKFGQTAFPLFKFHKSITPTYSSFPAKLSHYADLSIATGSEFLVPYEYNVFKAVDGYRNINVIEFENFIKNLQRTAE